MQGAYKPMPTLMSAPRMKLIPTAKPNCQPCKAMAVPPPGSKFRFLAAKAVPAITKAMPMAT